MTKGKVETIEYDEEERRDWPGRWLVAVTAGEYAGRKQVNFSLFHNDMPYNELIALLRECGIEDDGDGYLPYTLAASAVEDTFSTAQVEALRAFFAEWEGSRLQVRPAVMPDDIDNCMGNSARAVGGMDDFYMFCEHEGYDLPFKVWGYFNLRNHCPECGMAVNDNYCPACGVDPEHWRDKRWERIHNAENGTIFDYCRVDRQPEMDTQTCLHCGASLSKGDVFLAKIKSTGGVDFRGLFCSGCATYKGGVDLCAGMMLVSRDGVHRVSTDMSGCAVEQ